MTNTTARVVIKTAPGRNQYLIWSSVVDGAVAGPGTRGQVTRYLVAKCGYTPDEAERTLNRADELGSSDRVGFAWWDDDLPVGVGAPDDGWYYLRRDRLADYADALGRDDDAAAVALLECWQRHADGVPGDSTCQHGTGPGWCDLCPADEQWPAEQAPDAYRPRWHLAVVR